MRYRSTTRKKVDGHREISRILIGLIDEKFKILVMDL